MNYNFSDFLNKNTYKKVLLIADKKVDSLYPNFTDSWNCPQTKIFKLLIDGGEDCKQFSFLQKIWDILIENQFDKDDLLINWGGGTICDLGGFAAATFKRAIPFVNIPTTLMAMADAAHGGKTGINFHNVKNVIGVVAMPSNVFVDSSFLQTLPDIELLSGFAEIIKYSLIADYDLWNEISQISSLTLDNLQSDWIFKTYHYKNEIVKQDLYDNDIRQILNFGHTLGHAFESYFLSNGQKMPHGNAVALGMQYESFISLQMNMLSQEEYDDISTFIAQLYPSPSLSKKELEIICRLTTQDKKNRDGKISLTLLRGIGSAAIKQSLPFEVLKKIVFDYED